MAFFPLMAKTIMMLAIRNVTVTKINNRKVLLSFRTALRLISKCPSQATNAKNIALMIEEIKNIDMIGILTNNFSKKVY